MKPLPPGSTIGILGGGQLGRMTAQAAQRLGYKAHIFAADPAEPAFQVTPYYTLGDFHDERALLAFAGFADVVTLEWENIPVAALEFLQNHVPVTPGAEVLKITQDRLLEKQCAAQNGLAVPEFMAVQSVEELRAAIRKIGLPLYVKRANGGYDGKGQVIVREEKNLAEIWKGLKCTRAIAEANVAFNKEISVIVARNADGAMKTFPVVENRHKNGILDETHVPAGISADIEKQANAIATTLAEKLGVIGLLTVEMFVAGNKVLMNEMAPRVHNSGHWTLDFCATSQFEQLIRAVCGLPLGDTAILQPCMMKNLIGDDVKTYEKYLNLPGAHLHLYGKSEIRPGRKMGHVNLAKK